MSQAIKDFQDQIIKKALKHIDQDALAIKLAKELEAEFLECNKELRNNMDFQYWLEDELRNENSPAGKQFNKAMKSIAKKMADAICED